MRDGLAKHAAVFQCHDRLDRVGGHRRIGFEFDPFAQGNDRRLIDPFAVAERGGAVDQRGGNPMMMAGLNVEFAFGMPVIGHGHGAGTYHETKLLDGPGIETVGSQRETALDRRMNDDSARIRLVGIRQNLELLAQAIGHRRDVRLKRMRLGETMLRLDRIVRRVEALGKFLDSDDGKNLLAGVKRASNILRIEEKKDGKSYNGAVDGKLLDAAEEKALASAVATAKSEASAAVAKEDFAAAMTALAKLRPFVDAFFDKVTVNADDKEVRANRLTLLNEIREATRAVAGFSKIEG